MAVTKSFHAPLDIVTRLELKCHESLADGYNLIGLQRNRSEPKLSQQPLPKPGKSAIKLNLNEVLPILEPGQNAKEFDERVQNVISDYMDYLTERAQHHMGYPMNLELDSYKGLERLCRFCINNLGDPFIESNCGVHSRPFEIGVLNWFAQLWEIEDYWGYVTNGGTEGNLHGILVGRENFPDGILYSSRETHYSVFKAARMYRMDAVQVDTLLSGEIDYEHFRRELERNRGRPAIVNVNIGTTVKGAVDDVDRVLAILKKAGYGEDQFYIHCDGALFGVMMPFVKQTARLTFKKPIGSISVSGHKFIGAPMPCGVIITRKQYIMALSQDVAYLNSRDATITGSRNGQAPIYMWYTLTKSGYEGLRKSVERCMQNANLLKRMLEEHGVPVMLNELSSTVVFERPEDDEFIRKWQLACEGTMAHVVVMPNITAEKIKDFVTALVASRRSRAYLI
eukprot:jgi/Botrbrau1/7425/Bobra.0112s0024.1